MEIDKSRILELLHGDGKHDQAEQARSQLPDTVNTDKPEHADLLSRFGLNVDDLKGKLGGLGKLL